MKILIAGVAPVSYGHIPRMSYLHSVKAVLGGLGINHDVEIRPVKLGENFKHYDKIIIFLASMRGFLAKGTLGVLWALHAAGEKAVISFDDWQIREAMIGIKNFAAPGQRELIMDKNPFGYLEHDIGKLPHFWPHLSGALDSLVIGEWPWRVVLPCYDGGDLSLLSLPNCKIKTYNPSVIFNGWYNKDLKPRGPKTKEWVLAALHNHGSWLKKQNVGWNTRLFGHRKQGQPRVTEVDIVNEYASCWGVLSPAYKIAGSGWWRARCGLAADVGSVLAGDPKEFAMIDKEAYKYRPADIEAMDETQLKQVAEQQYEAYYKAAGTDEQFIEKLEECFIK